MWIFDRKGIFSIQVEKKFQEKKYKDIMIEDNVL